MPYADATDTIVACATPVGRSARAILRLSGPRAHATAMRLCRMPAGTGPGHPGRGRHDVGIAAGEEVVAAGLYLLPAPKTYTREEVAELHIPGSPALIRSLLEEALAAGLRQAAPGEFTFRAFANGRIDLAQAEGVAALIAAGSERERRAALSRLDGLLTGRIRRWRDRLLEAAARIEGELDFESDEVEPLGREELAREIDGVRAAANALSVRGRAAGENRAAVRFLGRTNAGKSSLVNALLGREETIVSPERSTTRDCLAFEWSAASGSLWLEDTPGMDASPAELDAAASERGRLLAAEADAAVLVVDGSLPPAAGRGDAITVLPEGSAMVIPVLNKCDLGIHPEWEGMSAREICPAARGEWIRVSARSGEGLDRLREALVALAADENQAMDSPGPRVAAALEGAALALGRAADLLRDGREEELVAEELRSACGALGESLGEGYAAEVLERIFARFCIGK